MIPTKMFFVKGVGIHKERLASFELALRDAGIEKFNLVHVSSIFPPGCICHRSYPSYAKSTARTDLGFLSLTPFLTVI